jgi:hypothetical protein
MLKNKVIILLLSLVVVGCGYRQTNTQIRDIGYLKFNKSVFKSYKVVVNNKYQFKLDACVEQDDKNQCQDNTFNKLYKVSSGNLDVKVYNNDILIMDKEVYVGSSNTVEINLK